MRFSFCQTASISAADDESWALLLQRFRHTDDDACTIHQNPSWHSTPSRPAVDRSGVGAQHRRATAAAPWSVRARDNAPVAIPLLWAELHVIDSADEMTVAVAMDYLAPLPDDPWADMLTTKERVTTQMLASLGRDGEPAH